MRSTATTCRCATSASCCRWTTGTRLPNRLQGAGTKFIIEPHIRFKGEVGEQATMFFLDPSGNALEFKAFKDIGSLFAK